MSMLSLRRCFSSSVHGHHHRPVIQATDFAAVRRAALFRKACKFFDGSRPLPEGAVEQCVDVAMRSPSGWNLQPWVFVVVRDPLKKQLLQTAALGQRQVLEAPVTVVVGANRRIGDLIERSVRLGLQTGAWSSSYAQKAARDATFYADPGPCHSVQWAKRLALEVVRPFRPVPTIPETVTGYVEKHTALACQSLMLAAASMGIDTCPMEGIDATRVRRVVNLPDHFSVPMIISMGYSIETTAAAAEGHHEPGDRPPITQQMPRHPRHELLFEDSIDILHDNQHQHQQPHDQPQQQHTSDGSHAGHSH